jgi:hypothetical protein
MIRRYAAATRLWMAPAEHDPEDAFIARHASRDDRIAALNLVGAAEDASLVAWKLVPATVAVVVALVPWMLSSDPFAALERLWLPGAVAVVAYSASAISIMRDLVHARQAWRAARLAYMHPLPPSWLPHRRTRRNALTRLHVPASELELLRLGILTAEQVGGTGAFAAYYTRVWLAVSPTERQRLEYRGTLPPDGVPFVLTESYVSSMRKIERRRRRWSGVLQGPR